MAKKRRIMSQFKELEGAYWGCAANDGEALADGGDAIIIPGSIRDDQAAAGGAQGSSQGNMLQAANGISAPEPDSVSAALVPRASALSSGCLLIPGDGEAAAGGGSPPNGGRLGLFSRLLSSATHYSRMVSLAEVSGGCENSLYKRRVQTNGSLMSERVQTNPKPQTLAVIQPGSPTSNGEA